MVAYNAEVAPIRSSFGAPAIPAAQSVIGSSFPSEFIFVGLVQGSYIMVHQVHVMRRSCGKLSTMSFCGIHSSVLRMFQYGVKHGARTLLFVV